MDSRFQGMGLYSLIFGEGVSRAKAWGLKELELRPLYVARSLSALGRETVEGDFQAIALAAERTGRALCSVWRRARRVWQDRRSPCD
jgi:hypothetical protein